MALTAGVCLAPAPAPAQAPSQEVADPAGDSPVGPRGGADMRRVGWAVGDGQLTFSLDWVLAPQGGGTPAEAFGFAWLDTSGDAVADYALRFNTSGASTVQYELHALGGGSPGCQSYVGSVIAAGDRPMSGSPGGLQSWNASVAQSAIGGATSFRWAVLSYTLQPSRELTPPAFYYDYVPDSSKGDAAPNPADRTCSGGSGVIADLAQGASFPPPANRPPIASFTFAPERPRTDQTVTLDGSASTDPDGTVVRWDWDLDADGAYDDASGRTVSTTFGPGAREAALQVTDDQGASATTRRTIEVAAATCPVIVAAGMRPEARTAITRTGTPVCDVLIGTAAFDVLTGLGGNDALVGLGGNDRLDGGSDDDLLVGDNSCPVGTRGAPFHCFSAGPAGSDRMFGGSGDDVMLGEGGHDRLSGQGGADRIRGGAGNDRVAGGTGLDVLRGDGGNDRVTAGADGDHVTGGAGKDSLNGGTGRDLIEAGSGSDIVRARDGTRDRIRCGRGRDRVLADRIDRIARRGSQRCEVVLLRRAGR